MIIEALTRLAPGVEFTVEGEEYKDIVWPNDIALFTEDEVSDEVDSIIAEIAHKKTKYTGVEFEGVMCSATKEDMWGLNSIRSWVIAGNDVNFEFDNGNVLKLTRDNYAAFEAVWIPFRASFF